MSTRFEFRLIGADAPDGQLDAEDLLAIVSSLKRLATRLGRVEVNARSLGRPPRNVDRVARLRVGLVAGSTRLIFERSVDSDALDLDLADEDALDQRLRDVVDAIAADERPDWVDDSLAANASELTVALQRAAPEVEFVAAEVSRARFRTDQIHVETWRPGSEPTPESAVLVGRLEAVDLKSHRFRVRDDLGNAVSLPEVQDDTAVKHLIGSYVYVTGLAERRADGRVESVRDSVIVAAQDLVGATVVPAAVPLDEILAGAPGPQAGAIDGLTSEEAGAFAEAMGW